ncbi:MAG: uncharacterized protein QOK43_171 [Acidimicrobiaceae bacterium]|nr:uncharacterized protein [Acidimicrobiaceae bacterium]
MFLRAQGFLGAIDRRAGVPGVLRRLGAVQLDTISVLARSHELVPYARLGPTPRAAVESAYWGPERHAFEYWGHAASILPIEDWPWCAGRRRRYRDYPWKWQASEQTFAEVRARLADGPITTADVGGAKRGGEWWDWSEAKVALERLLAWGEAVCVERRGWRRVYDLPERVIPAHLLAHEPPTDECNRVQVALAGRHLGVATVNDLADYYRLRKEWVKASLPDSGLVPVEVAGWAESAWADPDALGSLGARGERGERGRHRTTLLSPFDSLVWDRARTLRMFGVDHRLEAYTPKAKRALGYFAMPALVGGKLVARVDPKRVGKTLVAQQVTYQRTPGDRVRAEVRAALEEAAQWVGCDSVVLEREVELRDVRLWW